MGNSTLGKAAYCLKCGDECTCLFVAKSDITIEEHVRPPKPDNTCPMCGTLEKGRAVLKFVDVGYYRNGAAGTARVEFRHIANFLLNMPGALVHTITEL